MHGYILVIINAIRMHTLIQIFSV